MSTSKEPREVNSIAALEGACGSGAPRMGGASNGTSSNTGIDRRTFLGAVTVVPLAAGLGFSAPIPQTIFIAVPYPGAAKSTEYWANAEDHVRDWEEEGPEAERCTVAFAAVELKRFLMQTVPGTDIRFTETLPEHDAVIVVGPTPRVKTFFALDEVPALPGDRQAYAIHSLQRGGALLLVGGGRQGVLYAVYDYLGQLGWRWYAPGPMGEVAAAKRTSLPLDGWKTVSMPDFPLFRGFHAEGMSKESAEMFQWMARNRLNMWAFRCTSHALMRKLGLVFLSGGHILEDILNADKPMPSGKTLFEEHTEWFAEVNGKRERKNAGRYQFCVSNDAAVAYVAASIIEHFQTDWKPTDFQNVWMFDTWADWCQCSRCQGLGNDADRYLHFLGKVREAVNAAIASGEVKRDIGLVMCAYEGTSSLYGPAHPVPAALRNGKDFVLYAPINRCYAHPLGSHECTEFNRHYDDAVQSWSKVAGDLPFTVVEYYSVSKFEDLPLLFSRTMGKDFAYYHQAGVKGMSYMHIPMALWGPRALTQTLFARLSWDSGASVEKIRQEYMTLYYGPAAAPMAEFYRCLEDAYANITAWRSWAKESVNAGLLAWDGGKPQKPLFPTKHLQLDSAADRSGPDVGIGPRASIDLLERARAALAKAQRVQSPAVVRLRLEEDARLFRYGDESFRFYLEMARLYEARRLGKESEARTAWTSAEKLADSLRSYYMPFDFDFPGAGVGAKDALTRSQLRPLLDKLAARPLAATKPES
ncbi:MAG: DUF4838 domain-containing protein [Acidobacteriota bacterium]|nr:DUF4838 domain-containing protein [Acidobacteriota bacterium]